MNVDEEIKRLQAEIARLGSKNSDGIYEVEYGILFNATTDIFEAILGTLKAAKKRGIIEYPPKPLLLYPQDAKVIIKLLVEV